MPAPFTSHTPEETIGSAADLIADEFHSSEAVSLQERGEIYARENPAKAVLIALAIGVILGRIVVR